MTIRLFCFQFPPQPVPISDIPKVFLHEVNNQQGMQHEIPYEGYN